MTVSLVKSGNDHVLRVLQAELARITREDTLAGDWALFNLLGGPQRYRKGAEVTEVREMTDAMVTQLPNAHFGPDDVFGVLVFWKDETTSAFGCETLEGREFLVGEFKSDRQARKIVPLRLL